MVVVESVELGGNVDSHPPLAAYVSKPCFGSYQTGLRFLFFFALDVYMARSRAQPLVYLQHRHALSTAQ